MKRILFIILVLLLATPAYGRRGNREGFNFGTSVRVMGGDDRTNSEASNDPNSSHIVSKSQSVSPFVGYAFREFLNLGIGFHFEQSKSQITDRNSDGTQETLRVQDTSLSGAGLFTRFLFANVMFFEGGLGLYEQRSSTEIEQRNLSAGSINGQRSESEQRGIGPGYHVGGGLELPVVSNFYFTATYLLRSYQQREYNASAQSVGGKRGVQDRQELTFGIMHYYQ